MSTSKHFDKICIIVIVLALILTVLFMNGTSLGIQYADRVMGYESRLFDTEKVHTIDIVMDDWDSFISNCESEEYQVCTVVIDGEKFGSIGIRAKGNTSMSSVSAMDSQRYSFKLEFDQYQDGKSYYGLDKLCLNNLIQDNTMMKDYLSYTMMREFGVDAPLCSFAYITVNGEDWGLYLAVEGVEDSFLQRNYGSDSGELYKPDSMSMGGGRGNGKDFDMSDFDFSDFGDSEETETDESKTADSTADEMTEMPAAGGEIPSDFDASDFSGEVPSDFDASTFSGEIPSDFDASDFSGTMPDISNIMGGGGFSMSSDDVKLKYIDDDPNSYSNIFDNAKTDITENDETRLINSLKNLNDYTDLENTVDVDEVIRYFVVHNFIVNGDSYTGTIVHNYYLYEKDGQLSMIPWDYNLGFGSFQGGDASNSVNTSIDSPVSGSSVDDRPMLGWIFSDEKYTEQYHELFTEFTEEWIDSGKLVQLIDDTAALISPYVESDPTKFCTYEEFEDGVSTIREFVTLRGEAVERQLAGDTTKVDTSDLDISKMGTMNSTQTGMGGGAAMPEMPGGSMMPSGDAASWAPAA